MVKQRVGCSLNVTSKCLSKYTYTLIYVYLNIHILGYSKGKLQQNYSKIHKY